MGTHNETGAFFQQSSCAQSATQKAKLFKAQQQLFQARTSG
jgi:hypothetical protein